MMIGSAMLAMSARVGGAPQKPAEGRIAVPGGTVTWRRFGDGPKTPLLLIHGGPGFPSDYLEPLSALGDERPVYVWDQLGCGRSDRPTGAALWTLNRFVQEFDAVRTSLIPGRVHILGHSWGSMLAMEWLITKRPANIGSIIFAGECLSVPRYIQDAEVLIKTLTPASQAAIAEADRTGNYNTPAYQAAFELDWAPRYLTRVATPANNEFLLRALTGMGAEPYALMWGPSEFKCTGVLKTFDRTKELASLRLPVLFHSGEFDECRPETAREHAAMTPGAEFTLIRGAAHLTMLDAPAASVDAIRRFLSRVERA
jgi:proline iminopeptidase